MSDDLTFYVSGPREAVEAVLRRQVGGVGADAREGYARRAELEAVEARLAALERRLEEIEIGAAELAAAIRRFNAVGPQP